MKTRLVLLLLAVLMLMAAPVMALANHTDTRDPSAKSPQESPPPMARVHTNPHSRRVAVVERHRGLPSHRTPSSQTRELDTKAANSRQVLATILISSTSIPTR